MNIYTNTNCFDYINNDNFNDKSNDKNMSSRNPVEPKEHLHTMVFAGSTNNHCEVVHIYMCSDQDCGYWTSESSYNSDFCDMQVTRFSTRVTCSECSKCGKRSVDHS